LTSIMDASFDRHARVVEKRDGVVAPGVVYVAASLYNAVDLLKAGSISLIIYTGTTGAHAFADEKAIRRNAVTHRVPCITTISGARAAVEAIASKGRDPIRVWSLQEIHGTTTAAAKR